jgi:hypothetical protein
MKRGMRIGVNLAIAASIVAISGCVPMEEPSGPNHPRESHAWVYAIDLRTGVCTGSINDNIDSTFATECTPAVMALIGGSPTTTPPTAAVETMR